MSIVKNPDTNFSYVAGVKLGTQQKIRAFKIISPKIAYINQYIILTIDFSRHLTSRAYFKILVVKNPDT